mmetsp:Transcript_4556/g.14758  ORF Transcript_4556/g.14758 Transcript_4556/m.14758 type:complete len:267 (-) Transcript_4556:39-839(-)
MLIHISVGFLIGRPSKKAPKEHMWSSTRMAPCPPLFTGSSRRRKSLCFVAWPLGCSIEKEKGGKPSFLRRSVWSKMMAMMRCMSWSKVCPCSESAKASGCWWRPCAAWFRYEVLLQDGEKWMWSKSGSWLGISSARSMARCLCTGLRFVSVKLGKMSLLTAEASRMTSCGVCHAFCSALSLAISSLKCVTRLRPIAAFARSSSRLSASRLCSSSFCTRSRCATRAGLSSRNSCCTSGSGLSIVTTSSPNLQWRCIASLPEPQQISA